MANNRMYLVYRPTGDAVYLGRRMDWGWHGTPDDVAEKIANLLEKASDYADGLNYSQDDFAIALEQGDGHPHAISNFEYKGSSTEQLNIHETVPYGKPQKI